MAVYDLEEQEQMDELKSWWSKYRNILALVVVAASVTIAGVQGWRYYQDKQGLDAGALYAQLQTAMGAGDLKKVQDIASSMVDSYPRSAYAAYAALAGARAAYGSGDAAAARLRLQWVADNAKEDELREVARLRLATVLLDEKKYDEALKLLEAKHGDAMKALYANLKGDVLVTQGKNSDARGAYQLALDRSDAQGALRSLVQVTLDAVGEAK